MNFFPVFSLNCQFQLFLHNFKQNSKKIRFKLFSCNFVLELEKVLALRPIWNKPWRFVLVLVKKDKEEIGMFLFEEEEKLEVLAKIFTLAFSRYLD